MNHESTFFVASHNLRRGDVVNFAGRPAVVTKTEPTWITVAWRDSRFWRVVYWLRAWWLLLLLVPLSIAASFWMWRAFILWVVRS